MGCPLLIYRCLCAELHVMGCILIIVDPGVFGLPYLLLISNILSTPDCSLQCILGRAISEYLQRLLSMSSKLLLGPNLLALQKSSFLSRHPVCPPKSLPGVSTDADSLHKGHQQLSGQQSCAGVRVCLIMTAGGAGKTACQALGEQDASH